MKRILQVFVTRWLSKTPLGIAVLGAGWFVSRRRRKAREAEENARFRPGRRRQPQRASRR
ncbi:DUF6203 family protein [Herbidospora galbida]|uniref:DUF6203 family protein n=1 Tax=Herbidospora galbida TaxID=2575442 RepID=UPI003CCC5850